MKIAARLLICAMGFLPAKGPKPEKNSWHSAAAGQIDAAVQNSFLTRHRHPLYRRIRLSVPRVYGLQASPPGPNFCEELLRRLFHRHAVRRHGWTQPPATAGTRVQLRMQLGLFCTGHPMHTDARQRKLLRVFEPSACAEDLLLHMRHASDLATQRLQSVGMVPMAAGKTSSTEEVIILMSNPLETPSLIARLGTKADEQEVYELWTQNNPASKAIWSTCAHSGEDLRLVLRLSSERLAASLRFRIAWTCEQLASHLGFSIDAGEGDLPALTTTQSCSLPDARYLDVLRYQLLRFARHARIGPKEVGLEWHLGVHSIPAPDLTSVDQELLGRMGYVISDANSQSKTLVMSALPSEHFETAYETRNCEAVKSVLPPCIYRGRQPFQKWKERR